MPQQPSENPQVVAARAENVGLRSRIRALADEVASDRDDVYVVEVQVRGQQGSRVIEVFVDTDAGAGADDLARLSREIAFLLDTEDLVKGKYYLNVSSPGAERPLVMPRQYRKHVGRRLIVTTEGEPAARTGTLAAVRDDAFDLDVDGDTQTIPFADVTDARVQLPW